MCEICVSAAKELRDFAKQLEEKYPGASVDNIPVSPTHHVLVALTVLAEEYAYKELAFQASHVNQGQQAGPVLMTREGKA